MLRTADLNLPQSGILEKIDRKQRKIASLKQKMGLLQQYCVIYGVNLPEYLPVCALKTVR